MKLVIVHGEDAKKSRERFVTITKGVKKKGWSVVYLKPEANFESELTNKSLFEDENLYVVEEATKLSPSKLDWISKNSDKFDSQLFIYSKKKLPATTLKKFPKNASVEEFSLPKIIFSFTDSLFPGNSERALNLLKQLEQEKQPFELLVSLMGKYFRDLYWIQHGGVGLTYPDWRMRKLKTTANKFTKGEIEDIITNLADIDYRSKSSDVNVWLLLEMLILEKL